MIGPTAVREAVQPDGEVAADQNVRTAKLLGITTAVGLWLRLVHLGDKSLWLDEVSSAVFGRMNWSCFGRLTWARQANMLLYYLLLRCWIQLGQSQFTRGPLSVIFGVVTLPAV